MTKNKLYEGMFLIDSALAGSNWDGVNKTIKKILEKAEAEIVSINKWDDRKLAYDIKGKGRGTYILCYFRVDGEKIGDIEKAVKLSEQIMRVLILSAERMSEEDLEKETPAMKAEKEIQKSPVEGTPAETEADQESIDQETEKKEDSQQAERAGQADVTEQAHVTEQADMTEQTDVTEQNQEEITEDRQ